MPLFTHFKQCYIQVQTVKNIFKRTLSPPLIMSIASPAIYIHEPGFHGVFVMTS